MEKLAKGFSKDTKNSTYVSVVSLHVSGQIPADYNSILGAFTGFDPAITDIVVVGL